MGVIKVKAWEKESKQSCHDKPNEMLEFRGKDAWYKLYVHLATKFGFNGNGSEGISHEKTSQSFLGNGKGEV